MVARINTPLVAIVGPTASGKSDLAMRVAKRLSGEIICADSRTIYRGMDIGTAKPSRQDQVEVRHHLLDVVDPDQPFTAADFKQLALAAINDIATRGKLPIMVGGSGLYVDSVLFDYKFGKPTDTKLRKELSQKTVQELQDICRRKNIELPENYLNRRYLIRAIELGGLIQQERVLRPDTMVVCITTEKETLHSRIQARIAQMVKGGIVLEVAKLSKKYGWDAEPMKGNIYRAFRGVVEDGQDVAQAVDAAVQSDIRLTKKQLTWFKRNPYIIWGAPDRLLTKIEQFVKSKNLGTST